MAEFVTKDLVKKAGLEAQFHIESAATCTEEIGQCYVVIELRTGDFKPEYAGQLNFHLSAVDDVLKREQDNPSIGLLLCKSKNDLAAKYSLKDMSKPMCC